MAVTSSAIWEVESGGSDSNGGCYDSTQSGAVFDYSQQSAAQATGTVTSTGTAVVSTGAIFTRTIIPSIIWE
jgi:hypothetical protein